MQHFSNHNWYLQFPYLQWNNEDMLFLLELERLNPNLRKKFQDLCNILLQCNKTSLSNWIRFLTQILLLTRHERNPWLPSWDSNGKRRTVTDFTTLKRSTKPHDIHKSIWLVYYQQGSCTGICEDHFQIFTRASFLFLIS